MSKGLGFSSFGNISNTVNILANAVKACYTINKVSDVKAVEASTNCTKNEFTLCLDMVSYKIKIDLKLFHLMF